MSEHEVELAWTRRSKEAEHVHLIAQARCRSCVEREAERDRLIQALERVSVLAQELATGSADKAWERASNIVLIAREALTKTTEEVTPNRPTSTP